MSNVGDSIGKTAENVASLSGSQAAFLGMADSATEKFTKWGEAAALLSKSVEIIATGVEFISGIGRFANGGLTTLRIPLSMMEASYSDHKLGMDAYNKKDGGFWEKFKAFNATGAPNTIAAADKNVDWFLKPFDGIAQRDSLGVGAKVDRFINGNGSNGSGPGMSTTIQITVPAGSPEGLAETIANTVDQRVRDQASNYARILMSQGAVDARGRFATAGAH
jgi:hypothetical protein